MRVAILIIVAALLGGCVSRPDNSGSALPANALAVPDGATFDVVFEGGFLKDPGFKSNYPLRVADFLDFRWVPNPRHPIYARVTRAGGKLTIDLIAPPADVVASMSATVSEVREEGRIVLRHAERKTDGDEWGSRYYGQKTDFYLTDDGSLVLHIHSEGIYRSLLIVPFPYRQELLMAFPKEPNQPPQRNAGSRPSSGDLPVSETPSSLGPRG